MRAKQLDYPPPAHSCYSTWLDWAVTIGSLLEIDVELTRCRDEWKEKTTKGQFGPLPPHEYEWLGLTEALWKRCLDNPTEISSILAEESRRRLAALELARAHGHVR